MISHLHRKYPLSKRFPVENILVMFKPVSTCSVGDSNFHFTSVIKLYMERACVMSDGVNTRDHKLAILYPTPQQKSMISVDFLLAGILAQSITNQSRLGLGLLCSV